MADPNAPHPLPRINVEVTAIAEALGLSTEEFRRLMDSGRIRTLSERGVDSDLGHFRLSFWHGKQRYRIVTDAQGKVLSRETG